MSDQVPDLSVDSVSGANDVSGLFSNVCAGQQFRKSGCPRAISKDSKRFPNAIYEPEINGFVQRPFEVCQRPDSFLPQPAFSQSEGPGYRAEGSKIPLGGNICMSPTCAKRTLSGYPSRVLRHVSRGSASARYPGFQKRLFQPQGASGAVQEGSSTSQGHGIRDVPAITGDPLSSLPSCFPGPSLTRQQQKRVQEDSEVTEDCQCNQMKETKNTRLPLEQSTPQEQLA